MPQFERANISIYFEEHGSGFPLLLFAPGGMRSAPSFWERAPFNPIKELSSQFRVIAFDQRNAGRSRAPVTAADGWQSYTADHVALLDHLGIERCHLLGMCIGGAFGLSMVAAAPQRVAAAVLLQPIGHSPTNRDVFYELFDAWAKEQAPQHPEATPADFASFRERMYGGEFVFSVDRAAVRVAKTPLLVLLGNDVYHPSGISREVAQLAPSARLIERWKDADVMPDTVNSVREFLLSNTRET
jgi:pimeloyl-ACP methyl ester carboxylesterase